MSQIISAITARSAIVIALLKPAFGARALSSVRATGLLVAITASLAGTSHAQERPVGPIGVREAVYGMPNVFEVNVGQAGAHVSHLLRARSHAAAFRPDGFDIAVLRTDPQAEGDVLTPLLGNLIGLTFVGSNVAEITPGERVEGTINILSGIDPRNWHVDIPAFRTLGYSAIYDGVDLAFRSDRGGLEFAFDLAPGARLETVRIAIEGAERLALTDAGALVIHTSGGPIELTAPEAVQIRDNKIETVPAAFTLLDRTEVGFIVERRDPAARLVIDPLVVFQSYFGGDGAEGMAGHSYSRVGPMRPIPDLKLSPDGTQLAISGTTSSFLFPQPDSYGVISGTRNAFAARFGISGNAPALLFATVIGGSGGDWATGIAPRSTSPVRPGSPIAPSGGVFLSGWTESPDFPTSPRPLHPTRDEGGGFLVELGAQGQFLRGTMLGHGRDTYPNAIALDLTGPPRDHAVIVGGGIGYASGIDEAIPGPDASPSGGALSGFVAAVRLSLRSYRYFTYVGGSGFDVVHDVDVLEGSAYAVGTTTSFDLDTGFPFIRQAAHSGIGTGASPTTCVVPEQAAISPSILHTEFSGPLHCFDGFMVRFTQTGEPLFLTYDGTGEGNFLHGVAIDRREDNLGFVAATGSILTGPQTARVALRRATNAGGLYGPNLTIGTGPSMIGESIAFDSEGRAHIVGSADDPGLATGAGSQVLTGSPHIFYLQVDAGATSPVFFTYLGGSRVDLGYAVDVVGSEADGYCAFVLGETGSPDLPASEAGQPVLDGASDLLLAVVCDGRIEIPPVTFDKNFLPGTISEPLYASSVRFSLTNPTTSSTVLTLFDGLPAGLTFTGGDNGCTISSASTVRCNLTLLPGDARSFELPVIASREACDVSYSNRARLYAGNFDEEPPGVAPLATAESVLTVLCRPREIEIDDTDCTTSPEGECLCGIDYGDCREDGYTCVFGDVDAGPSWGILDSMNGICRPEGFAEIDYTENCVVEYAWRGGLEILTLERGETLEIEQGDMRYVQNFVLRPPVDVRMSGVAVPEFTLTSDQRNPPPVFGDYVPFPFWETTLPVLHSLHCQRVP